MDLQNQEAIGQDPREQDTEITDAGYFVLKISQKISERWDIYIYIFTQIKTNTKTIDI